MILTDAQPIIADATEIASYLKEELQKELEAQGHNATGRLSQEIEEKIIVLLDEIDIEMYILYYGKYQDTGLKPDQIPYRRGSHAGTSKFIEALMKWAVVKKIVQEGSRQQRSFAFAVAEKMKKQGMPTDGAYAYTSNGRRKDWVTHTLKEAEPEIIKRALNMEFNVVDVAIENLIRDISKLN